MNIVLFLVDSPLSQMFWTTNARQCENGQSASRVKALLDSDHCHCKGTWVCYHQFRKLLNQLLQFLQLFWRMKKVDQDAYVRYLDADMIDCVHKHHSVLHAKHIFQRRSTTLSVVCPKRSESVGCSWEGM